MYELTMPKLSDSMEEGKIIQWKVKEGDEVREGDVLAEVESDKAVMELECFRGGVVAKIVHGDGEEVPVGAVIALIREKGEVAGPAAGARPRPAVEEEPAAAKEPPSEARRIERARRPGERIAISPYARKLAEERGIDYTALTGTGPGGRIVARDVEAAGAEAGSGKGKPVGPFRQPIGQPTDGHPWVSYAVPAQRPAQEKGSRSAPPAPDELPALEVTEDEAEVVPAPFRHKTQARRVAAAKRLVPHFYITRRLEVTLLLERQRQLKETAGATLTHLVILACLKTLKQHPEVNRSYDRGRIVRWKGVNLGLAVDTDEGLTVAVLRDAQDLSLEEIVQRTGQLVERARAGRLSADERRHATFTVTNLGMFAVDEFVPIINPPSSITLAVASAVPAAVVSEGAIRVGTVMSLTAACDHRIVDGVTAARFMQDLAARLGDPETLLVTA